ncbi:hypothetical protein [Acidithiobacillus caldus]|uniref:hypothetical protein n=1 Tax=Acidithiobacillus caldus TaxID=33059 RepID=UPI000310AFA0|nr:hypothetical protein [Acidithiobacillus caldus]
MALEDLVERKQLPLRYTHNLEVDVQLHAVLRDVGFRVLSTEALEKNALWT